MTKINAMWQQYPRLAPELTATLTLIEKNIKAHDPEVTAAIIDMIHAGGKLLRPAYCLLFAQFHETDRKKMIALAAAVETLHTATLIHDDIVDESNLRRNQPTIQARFGKDTAVYAGDYLFVVCFKLLAHYTSDLRSIQVNSNSMERILNGEIHQMKMRYQLSMSLDDYLLQIKGKTAQLFSTACFIGAYESGNTQSFVRQSEQIGMAIGTAFQIVDDILDYQQSSATLGKPVLEDVRQGVYSAPLVFALQNANPELVELLKKRTALTPAECEQIRQLVVAAGGVTAAQKLAADYTQQALTAIHKLPAGAARDDLEQLTQQLLTRKY
ncbi:polyprenyl synthetase family protein [Loigolactobacillus coryniformis]|uniref:Heptaprenyl diphosphate synthase n=1 Tax=Loigolactobacillus coryniformis subsp. torquens DSM 20004 = KCTC 3535 TaxID=1423822 RepID=A0A2D1KQC3_9LACO|nr:polyprenyl synthetase family protein [Loigolactobacillus coryniformis]ATO44326.1 heptaprenyl diphosphate synthase [Loigolactobacillus coryniformis subsp. torquens DSM 20004 = KCTC 3535]